MSHSPERAWLKYWLWLPFIPIKLHIGLPVAGYWIGDRLSQPYGGGVGLIAGLILGFPLQIIKGWCRNDDQGLDITRDRNLLQLKAGLLCAIAGAVIGFQTANAGAPPPQVLHVGITIAIGGFLGLVAGTFTSGAIMAFADLIRRIPRMAAHDSQATTTRDQS